MNEQWLDEGRWSEFDTLEALSTALSLNYQYEVMSSVLSIMYYFDELNEGTTGRKNEDAFSVGNKSNWKASMFKVGVKDLCDQLYPNLKLLSNITRNEFASIGINSDGQSTFEMFTEVLLRNISERKPLSYNILSF